jgi:DNA-binding NarL/FixJ family response regulator
VTVGPVQPRLTNEHIRILQLIAEGSSDRRIAQQMNLSVRTVRRRIAESQQALAATTRVTLVVRALATGVLPLPPP